MTSRLIKYLAQQPVETLRAVYGKARKEAKEATETSAEFDTYVLETAKQDNLLQTNHKIVTGNRAIAMTYMVLMMLKNKPECRDCNTREGVSVWLKKVGQYLGISQKAARIMVYNSVCDVTDED